MNFGFSIRENKEHGGDLVALNSLMDGLKELGHRVFTGPNATSLIKSDYIFLTNLCQYQLHQYHGTPLEEKKKPFGLITFQEDFGTYYPMMMNFLNYLVLCEKACGPRLAPTRDEGGILWDIDHLFEAPEILTTFRGSVDQSGFGSIEYFNRELYQRARAVFTSGPFEDKHVKKCFPTTKSHPVLWTAGNAAKMDDADDSFLKLTGLKSGEYVLQVGRLEPRKNQPGSIMAMKDVDIPLVFITPTLYDPLMLDWIKSVAVNVRKAPTIILSQDLPSEKTGNYQCMGNEGELFPWETVAGAYQNAGLHLHPAWHELPGLTYLEAAKCNLPQVASNWTGIKDYFKSDAQYDETLNGRVKYVDPYNLTAIKDAVVEQFGKKFPEMDHTIFNRTKVDLANDYLKHIQ